MTLDRSGTLHAKLHQIDSAFRAFRRGCDFVVKHEMAPVGPDLFGLAALRAASDEFRERLSSLSKNATASGVAGIRVLIDEYPIGSEHIGVIESVATTRIDAVSVSIDELRDLGVILGRQSSALGRDRCEARLRAACPECPSD